MKILKSLKPHDEISIAGVPYANFQRIKNFAPILYNAKQGEQLLITLSIPDTWCDRAGDGAWFAIKVNGAIVARGLYSCGINGQRVPMNLQAVIEVDSNKSFEIEAGWCNFDTKGICYIGRLGDTILTTIVNDELDKTIDVKLHALIAEISQGQSEPGHPVIWDK